MRLILHHGHFAIDPTDIPELDDDTYAFICFEDFTVGPLSDWNDRTRFDDTRAAFWQKTQRLTLPDGDQMDYFIWHQTLPRCDLVDMIQSGIAAEDIPLPQDWSECIAQAKSIEIWHDLTVRGQVFLWYTVAALQDFQIDPSCISTCALPEGTPSPEFWSDMVLDRPSRAVPMVELSAKVKAQALQYWDALTRLPTPVNAALLRDAPDPVRHAFVTLSERQPNAETGLTNIQARVLRCAPRDWQKMARVISNAMIASMDADDPVGDAVLQFELTQMAQMTPPLVEIDGEGAMRFCQVRLTDDGDAKRLSLDL